MLELVTPAAVQRPLRRPPASVFLVTTAKSGPGISTSTVAKARNSPYVAQVISAILPTGAGPRIYGSWSAAIAPPSARYARTSSASGTPTPGSGKRARIFKRRPRADRHDVTVEPDEHIAALDADGTRLAAAAELAGLDAPIPCCPLWKNEGVAAAHRLRTPLGRGLRDTWLRGGGRPVQRGRAAAGRPGRRRAARLVPRRPRRAGPVPPVGRPGAELLVVP